MIVTNGIRSRKVRKILRLDAEAEKWQGKYDTAVARYEKYRGRAIHARLAAKGLEHELTGGQSAELARARGATEKGLSGPVVESYHKRSRAKLATSSPAMSEAQLGAHPHPCRAPYGDR